MALSHLLLSLLAISTSVFAQSSTTYTDPDNGITFQGYTDTTTDVTIGLVFPEGSDSNDEFIGEIVSPLTNQWVGVCLGGTMLDNLLLVAWPYEDTVVYSPRYATSYSLPALYEGPTITSLESTSVNSTYWKWVFRCENCTTWTGGSINLTSTASPLAWALSNTTVDDPADPDSAFAKHTNDGSFEEDFYAAQSAYYFNWA
ncbi:iron reductase domain protein [Hydnomerulius pinastri MD-312]|uniref:Iron reductase domain protein n=1 Tax=Hydnomerulius pinastri MD-312 TaxID=994086 RepID=A0A0C9WD83_9AGAM|nr:iron reductase domain protein [Hydnomerulius pinastri MD-312]